MASRDLLEFQVGRGNQLSLWNVHQVPLGIEAGPDLSEKTRTLMGVGSKNPVGWMEQAQRFRNYQTPPPKAPKSPLK